MTLEYMPGICLRTIHQVQYCHVIYWPQTGVWIGNWIIEIVTTQGLLVTNLLINLHNTRDRMHNPIKKIVNADLVYKKKLHGLSPRANYTDRATAVCRKGDCQLLLIEGSTWSA
jgi:hypothetical protein